MTHADGIFFHFTCSNDGKIRNAVHSSKSNFGPNFITSIIDRDTSARIGERFHEFVRFFGELFRDRKHPDLLRSKPYGELPLEVLDKETDEALERAEGRAVDHDRNVRLIIRAYVAEIKALREIVIHLHGAELPVAADDVFDDEVDLRAVESGFAGLLDVVDAENLNGFAESGFSLVPVRRIADVFVRIGITEREADCIISHAESAEDFLNESEAALNLITNLLWGAEKVGIILGETADAREAAELAGLLPAIDGAELSEAHGQITVAAVLAIKDLDVVRAVHRLEEEALDLAGADVVHQRAAVSLLIRELLKSVALYDGWKLGILIIREVTRSPVKIELADVRGEDLEVALLIEFLGDEVFKLATNDSAFGLPEWEALANGFIEGEKIHLFSKTAVVTLLRFLKTLKMLVEHGLVFKTGAVDALKRLLVLISLVEGTGNRHDLEGFAVSGATDVRTRAEIPEVAIFKNGDLFVFGNVIEEVDLEDGLDIALGDRGETAALSESHRFIATDDHPLKGGIFLHHLLHLRLDLCKIIWRDAVLKIDIVIEATLDRRTGSKLGISPQTRNRRSENVSTGVAQALEIGHLVPLFQGLSVFVFSHKVSELKHSHRRNATPIDSLTSLLFV